jgi:Mrp family chromosome partitioning ATPase
MDNKTCDTRKPCDTCESGQTCSAREKEAHERKRLEQKLFRIRHKVMVMSGKGGVGKSTVATNLAAALALSGHKTGIIDADLHGPDVPRMLGIEYKQIKGRSGEIEPIEVFEGLKALSMALFEHNPDTPIIWRGPLKHAAIKQFLTDVNWGDLDFLIIDLPPGTGDEPLSIANLIKNVDGSIIVTTPQGVAVLDARKAVGFSRVLKIPVLGIVENMSGLICPSCGEIIDLFKVGGGQKAARELGIPFLGCIPIDPLVVELCDAGRPIVIGSADSDARKAFMDLTRKVLEALEPSAEVAIPAGG